MAYSVADFFESVASAARSAQNAGNSAENVAAMTAKAQNMLDSTLVGTAFNFARGLWNGSSTGYRNLNQVARGEKTLSQAGKDMTHDDKGNFSFAKTAMVLGGTYMGLSSAGRILSGGGIYKDADGNTDLIGIPFI